jgi:hypothetical protein
MAMLIENDRLVLYVEESCDNESGKQDIDMRCYILYDEYEGEYYICGSRKKTPDECYGDFKFFCKSKQSLMDYMAFILNVNDSKVRYGLFNYTKLFEDSSSYQDFDTLENSKLECSEIAFYYESQFKYKHVKKLLDMLKNVRY